MLGSLILNSRLLVNRLIMICANSVMDSNLINSIIGINQPSSTAIVGLTKRPDSSFLRLVCPAALYMF